MVTTGANPLKKMKSASLIAPSVSSNSSVTAKSKGQVRQTKRMAGAQARAVQAQGEKDEQK